MSIKAKEEKLPLTPDRLGELYPTAKSYDEKQADTEDEKAFVS